MTDSKVVMTLLISQNHPIKVLNSLADIMFYKPVQNKRWFRPEVRYSDIDWTNFATAVSEFKNRIDEWYIKPAKALQSSPHFGFSIMALNCLLTDTLSQFYSGEPESKQTVFKEFLRQQIPVFAIKLPKPIQTPDKDKKGNVCVICDFADALYRGFRCGILHEAHITSYGMLSGLNTIVEFCPSGYTKYSDGSDCPSVVVDPHRFLVALETFFNKYVSELLDPRPEFDEQRTKFKRKFSASFGLDIMNAR